MSTQCTPTQLEFHTFGGREVMGRFDAGRLTSDTGGIPLREVDRRLGPMGRTADCFTDRRRPGMIEHSVSELIAQRIHGIALGHEDLNDHDALCGDSLLALLAGKSDLDATDDPPHDGQEGRCFHGHYRHYRYLPLYIFCGEHLLRARLRFASREALREGALIPPTTCNSLPNTAWKGVNFGRRLGVIIQGRLTI